MPSVACVMTFTPVWQQRCSVCFDNFSFKTYCVSTSATARFSRWRWEATETLFRWWKKSIRRKYQRRPRIQTEALLGDCFYLRAYLYCEVQDVVGFCSWCYCSERVLASLKCNNRAILKFTASLASILPWMQCKTSRGKL